MTGSERQETREEEDTYLSFLGGRERLPLAAGVALVDGRDGELRASERAREKGVRRKAATNSNREQEVCGNGV